MNLFNLLLTADAIEEVLDTFELVLVQLREGHEDFELHQQISADIRGVLEGAGHPAPQGLSTLELTMQGLAALRDPVFLAGDPAQREALNDTLGRFFANIGRRALDQPGLAVLDQFVNTVPALALAAVDLFEVAHAAGVVFGDDIGSFGEFEGVIQVSNEAENNLNVWLADNPAAGGNPNGLIDAFLTPCCLLLCVCPSHLLKTHRHLLATTSMVFHHSRSTKFRPSPTAKSRSRSRLDIDLRHLTLTPFPY